MTPSGRPVALRTALIWHDEVMSDVVCEVPRKITLGHKGRPTFVIPDLGLPKNFAIISPGKRGYLLTLGERMAGKICIDGQVQDVREFMRRAGGEFHATPISGRDWGVIDLDETGTVKLFFQFVPLEKSLEGTSELFATLTQTAAAAAFFTIGLVVFMVAWQWIQGLTETEWYAWVQDQIWAEWTWRSALFITAGLVLFGSAWRLATSDAESQASTGFSVLLHAALLMGTIILYDPSDDPNVWPGPRALTGNYLVTRVEETTPPEVKVAPTVGKVNKQEPAALSPAKENIKTATKGDEGAAGGKGEQERARDPNAKDVPPEPPKVAFFEDKNRKILDNIVDRSLATNLGKFTGIKGDTLKAGSLGFGAGTGTGVGEGVGTGTTRGSKGKGSGGGGNVEGDFVSNKGPVDTGKERPGGKCVGAGCTGSGPKEVKVSVGEMTGDPGGYTEDEINRVVKARAGVFRACYQKELNRSPGIGGKVVVKFKIGSDGSVEKADATGSSTLTNAAVQDCVTSNVMRLRFPPKGAVANVVYPFLFSPGG